MITLKSSDVIAVVANVADTEFSRSTIVYAKSGKVLKTETSLTARAIESKLKAEYYITIK